MTGTGLKIGVAVLLLAVLGSCGGGAGEAGGTANSNSVPEPVATAWRECIADANGGFASADYYVDGNRPDDSGDGLTPATAWKTIGYAVANALPGKTVFVNGGNYGAFSETTPAGRGDYLTIRAAPGHSPILTKISIQYPSKAPAFLRIIGMTIKNTDRAPDGGSLVRVERATDVELLNNVIRSETAYGSGYVQASASPGNPSSIYGVAFNDVERILLKSNCVTGVRRGVTVGNAIGVEVKRNFIAPQAETAIQVHPNVQGMLVEDNHIRGMPFTPFCLDSPRPSSAAACAQIGDANGIFDPHASMISIRSDGVTIRNNIMHGMGTTSGIRTYEPDAVGGEVAYSSITIEGNLIYDVHHPHVLQLMNLGDNFVVRNNLLVSRYRLGSCADGVVDSTWLRYETALIIPVVAIGDGSGLQLTNNIFVGATFLNGALPIEANNIFWSYAPTGFTFSSSTPSGTSRVVVSSQRLCGGPVYFEAQNFFAVTPNFAAKHGLLLDYRPLRAAESTGFGDPATQLSRKLGHLDANGFFINEAGNRGAGENSAGPYEPL